MIDFSMRTFLTRSVLFASCLAASAGFSWNPAQADKIKHPIAVFSGLDKITGRIISFEVATDETVQFGSLQITERACYTRPATEAPQTITFVEVDEVDTSNDFKRIFTGWMFAASPGLHGIEHPVYDIWLKDCKGGTEVVASPAAPDTAEATPAPPDNAKLVPENPAPKPKPAPKARRAPPPPPVEDAFGDSFSPGPRGAPPPDGGAIEVGPPPGLIPNAPAQRRAPQQRYYPTAPSPDQANPGGFN